MAEQIGIKLALDGAAAVQSGLRNVGDALGNLSTRTLSVADAFRSLAPALAASLSVGAITAWARGAVNAIDAMNDLADATGATVEQISALDGFARRTGTTLDNVGGILVKFNGVLNQTGADNGVSQALRAIGLDTAVLRRQDPVQALQATAQALSQFADDGNKARLVQELFGKSIREAAPILKDLAEAGKLNATVTAQQAAEAEKFNRALAQFKANAEDAGRSVVQSLLPGMNDLLQRLNAAKTAFGDLSEMLSGKITVPGIVPGMVQAARALYEFSDPAEGYAEYSKRIAKLDGDLANPRIKRSEYEIQTLRKQREELERYQKFYADLASTQGAFGPGGRGGDPRLGRKAPSVPGIDQPADPLSAIQDPRQQYRANFLRSEKAVYQELEREQERQLEEARKRDAGYAEYQLQLQDQVTRALMDGEAFVTQYMQEQEQARLAELKIRAQQELGNLQRVDQAQAESDAAAARASQARLDAEARQAEYVLTLSDDTARALIDLNKYEADWLKRDDEDRRKRAADYAEYALTLGDDTTQTLIDLNKYEADWLKRDDEDRRKRAEDHAEYLLTLGDETTRALIDDEQALQQYLTDTADARKRALDSIGARAAQLQLEAEAGVIAADRNISLAEAIELVAIARLRERQAAQYRPGSSGWKELQDEIDARLKLVGLMGDERVREANRRAAEDAAAAWQRTVDQVGQSLADALMNGGLKAGDAIKRYFSTLVLQPIIKALIDPMGRAVLSAIGMGGTASSAAAGQAGASAGSAAGAIGLLGSATSIFGAGAAATMSGNVMGAMGSAGAMMSGGATVQGLAMGAGAAAPIIAGVMLGRALYKSISDGYSVGGGRMIGNLLGFGTGGIVNRAFGRKLTEQGVQGTFGGDSNFTGTGYTFEKGGWFRSDRTRTSALDPVMGGMLGQAFGALRTSTQAMADVLGQSGEAVRQFTADARINLRGLSDQQVTQRLQEEMGKLAESLADAALGTREYTRLGETQAQALTRLSGSLAAVNGALDLLARSTLSASLQSADLASKLSDLFGGDQGLASAVQAFQAAYYTEAERTAIATRQVTEAMAALHLALPTTRAQFRAIVEAQDLSTEAGRTMFAALLRIAPAFDAVSAGIDTLAGRLGALTAQLATDAASAVARQLALSQSAASAARQQAQAYRSAQESIAQAAAGLRGGSANAPGYAQTLAAARSGDLSALQALPALAQGMSEQLLARSSSRAQYRTGNARLAAELDGAGSTAAALAATRDTQAALYDVQAAALQVLQADLAANTLTVELLREHQANLSTIAARLGASGTVVHQLQSNDVTAGAAIDTQEVASSLLRSSDQTLARILAQLGTPDAGLERLGSQLQSGNQLVADRLGAVIGAIQQQTAAQASEIQRQQDLQRAQKELQGSASYLQSLQDSVAQAQATLAGTPATTSVRIGTRRDALGFSKGGIYEARDNPAYQTAAAAVAAAQQTLASYAPQVDALRELIRSLGGVPQFAAGGQHAGGLRIVGERGPELEATGPARYWNAADTTAMLGNGQRRDEALVAEIRALREQVARLEAAQVATAVNTGKTQRLMQRVTRDGESMQIVDVTPTP